MFSLFRKKVCYVNRSMTLEQLEERIVLDAAVPASVLDNAENVDNQDGNQAQPSDNTQEANTPPGSGEGNGENTDQGEGEYSGDQNPIMITNVPGFLSSGWEDAQGQWDFTKLLAISSQVEGAESLLEGASDDTAAFIYNAESATLDDLLLTVERILGPNKADSIGFAAHDLGEAKFHLTDGNTVSPGSLLGSADMGNFWSGVGENLSDSGRVDLFACDLGSTVSGELLLSQMEALTGHTVAASDDPTGAFSAGGDWTLEFGGVDLLSVYFSSKEPEGFHVLLAGEEKLLASDGAAGDCFGWSVAIDGYWAIIGAPSDDNAKGDRAGAAYIFHWDGADWTQQGQPLVASDGAENDVFGWSVAIDGYYAIVGARGCDVDTDGDGKLETNAGAAYIFHRDGADWTQQGQPLVASDGAENDVFGWSVAIDGNYAIVGASGCDVDTDGDGNPDEIDAGAAYIYDWNGTSWGHEQKLTSSDGAAGDYFGESVAIDGDYAIVGASGFDKGSETDAGAVYIYRWRGFFWGWGHEQRLTASDGAAGDYFGEAVAIDGDYAIVGASGCDVDTDGDGNPDEIDAGAAYIARWNGTSWRGVKLTASDGNDGDRFGWAVSISDQSALIGAPGCGASYAYYLDNPTVPEPWKFNEKLTPSDGTISSYSGWAVSTDGENALVGAWGDSDNGGDAGAAYVFTPNNAPVAVNDDKSTDEDTSIIIDVIINDDDVDEGDTISVKSVDKLGATGYVVLNGDGTINYDPNGQFEDLGAGDSDTDTFQYTIEDSHGRTDTATVTVTITGVNDDPVLTLDQDTGVVTEDQSTPDLSCSGSLSFTDVDQNDTHTISQQYNNDASWSSGTLTQSQINELTKDFNVSDTGWTYEVANSEVQFLGDGETVTLTYDVIVTDSKGASDSKPVEITITGVNDDPTASDNTVTTDEDKSYVFAKADFCFSDVDSGDSLKNIKINSDPGDGQLLLSGNPVNANSSVSIADINAGNFVFEPDQNGNGAPYTTFSFKVHDGKEFSLSPYTMTVNVTAVNDAPTGTPIPDPAPVEQAFGVFNYDVSSYFSDPDGPSMTYELGNMTYHNGLALSDIKIDPNTGEITFINDPNTFGSVDVQVRVYDGSLWCNWQTFTFTVKPEPVVQPNLDVVDSADPAKSNSTSNYGGENSESGLMWHAYELLQRLFSKSTDINEDYHGTNNQGNYPAGGMELNPHQSNLWQATLNDALYGSDGKKGQNDLKTFYGHKGNDNSEQQLGLEDFLEKLRKFWFYGDDNDPRLSFNAADIDLAEFLNSSQGVFAKVAHENGPEASGQNDHSPMKPYSQSMTFEMDEINFVQSTKPNRIENDYGENLEQAVLAGGLKAKLFDMKNISMEDIHAV